MAGSERSGFAACGERNLLVRVVHDMQAPATQPLDQWLRQSQVPVDDLQAVVDQFLTQAKQMAEQSTTEDTEEHRGEEGN